MTETDYYHLMAIRSAESNRYQESMFWTEKMLFAGMKEVSKSFQQSLPPQNNT